MPVATGEFVSVPVDVTDARSLVRRRSEERGLSLYLAEGKIEPEVAQNMHSWQHNGQTKVGRGDREDPASLWPEASTACFLS